MNSLLLYLRRLQCRAVNWACDRQHSLNIGVELLLYSDFWKQLEMWANAQRDGRPAEYRRRPLFNAAKFG